MGLRVWSGEEIFSKKIKTLWGGHIRPPPPLIITKVKGGYPETNREAAKKVIFMLHSQL